MAGEIFISYRRADEAWARLLYDRLRTESVEAWYDAQVGAGQDWRIATAKALQASKIFVLLFSSSAAQSTDIAKELAAAVFEKKLIVPVRLENIAPDGAFLYELASRNWINAFEDTEAKLAELAHSLAKLVKDGIEDESILPFDRTAGGKAGTFLGWVARNRFALAAMVIFALVGATSAFWLLSPRTPSSSVTQSLPLSGLDRIVVLPFSTFGGGDDARIFSQAVAEQIIATLNDVQVQTVSREDAAALNGTDRDAAAMKLGAEFILNGSVQSGEKGLHVTVHLDHASTHATVWTANYDQNGAPALELQSQIAAVASYVVAGALRSRREDPGEMNDSALGIALKMTVGGHDTTPEGLLKERDLARQFIAQAPKDANAYSNLAVVSALLLRNASPEDVAGLRADVRKAASQALALDPKNGGAYLALAIMVPSGRWAEQEAAFRKGLSVDPNVSSMYSYLADVLTNVGRLREALASKTTSQILDPQSPNKNASLAMTQVEAGHVAEGISTINRAAKTWPSSMPVWLDRFYIMANFGQEKEARAMLDSSQDIPVTLEAQSIAAMRAYLDALILKTPASKLNAEKTIRSAVAAGDISISQGIQMSAKLGDVDTAFLLARTLYAPQDSALASANTAPLFQSVSNSMRRDPRFMPLVAQVGLLQYWQTTGKWPDFCAEQSLPYNCRTEANKLKTGK